MDPREVRVFGHEEQDALACACLSCFSHINLVYKKEATRREQGQTWLQDDFVFCPFFTIFAIFAVFASPFSTQKVKGHFFVPTIFSIILPFLEQLLSISILIVLLL